MKLAFVNCTADTFTPTASGAICTWLWEVARVAQLDGVTPLIISRSAAAPSYEWPRRILLDYPLPPGIKGFGRLYRIHRDLTGWQHVRQAKYARSVVKAIKRVNAEDHVLVLNNDPELAVYLRACLPHTPILHLAHNNNPCAARFRSRFASAVTVAAAVSDFSAAWNGEHFAANTCTVLNGVDTHRFIPAPVLPPGPPVINFVGRTNEMKGPDLLLRAALKVAKRTSQFSIQILGSNHYDHYTEDAFQRNLVELGDALKVLGVNVRIAGWITRSNLPAELQKAHINCIPARWDEPFGLTTLEGMACGLATIASATGGTPQVVGNAGLLFQRENVDELASHLYSLITDERLCRSWGQAARARAEEMSWTATWRRLGELCAQAQSTARLYSSSGPCFAEAVA